jgi:hypothetical protein
MDIQNISTVSSVRLGSTGLLLLNETNVSRDHDGDGEARMLAKADYRAVTVKLILGNVRLGDDLEEELHRCRGAYAPNESAGFLRNP